MGKFIDLTGQRFGRLEVISPAFSDERNQWHWNCKCDCGTNCVKHGSSLRNGGVRSCGCLQKELVAKRSLKHGLRNTIFYLIRHNMMSRCYNSNNPGYKNYGGRGITVCDEWRDSLEAFYVWAINNGHEEGLTIERIDVNGNYCPDNCTWIPKSKQSNNQRSNNLITFNGETKTMKEWSEITGLSYSTIRSRKNSGWSDEKTIETPVLKTWSRHKQEKT